MLRTIARPYAKAVYSLAGKEADQWLFWLLRLAELQNNPTVNQSLTNPLISAEEKTEKLLEALNSAVKKSSQAKSETDLSNLALPMGLPAYLKVIFKANRWEVCQDVFEIFQSIYLAERQQSLAKIELATELSTQDKKQLSDYIGQYFEGELIAEYQTNPELIAGFRASINGKILEVSVADRLSRLERLLSH